jgi:hypothetical protein
VVGFLHHVLIWVLLVVVALLVPVLVTLACFG